MTIKGPPFEVIGLLAYNPVTDTLTATACPADGPPISVKVPKFLERIGQESAGWADG